MIRNDQKIQWPAQLHRHAIMGDEPGTAGKSECICRGQVHVAQRVGIRGVAGMQVCITPVEILRVMTLGRF